MPFGGNISSLYRETWFEYMNGKQEAGKMRICDQYVAGFGRVHSANTLGNCATVDPDFAGALVQAQHPAYIHSMMNFIPFLSVKPKVAVVRLHGVISASGRGALSEASIGPVLERAFRRGKPVAVALLINSPGGSPVQSALIGMRIRSLASEMQIPVYAFVEDVAASGGYWLASAADEIWADAASIVGSVGVISSGFGLAGFIEKHGIERRVYTAGKSKSTNDPFLPEKPADVKRLKVVLEQMHDVFKEQITSRRGGKLADQDLFTGEYWIGKKALELGLIDGIGHMMPKMREQYGEKVVFIPYGQKKPLLRRLGAQVLMDTVDHIEERSEFSRFGL